MQLIEHHWELLFNIVEFTRGGVVAGNLYIEDISVVFGTLTHRFLSSPPSASTLNPGAISS